MAGVFNTASMLDNRRSCRDYEVLEDCEVEDCEVEDCEVEDCGVAERCGGELLSPCGGLPCAA